MRVASNYNDWEDYRGLGNIRTPRTHTAIIPCLSGFKREQTSNFSPLNTRLVFRELGVGAGCALVLSV